MQLSPSPLDQAILSTLLYGDVFSFPMTAEEVHYFLIGMVAEQDEVRCALESPSAWLGNTICAGEVADFICYAIVERAEEILAQRRIREAASATLWPKGRRYGVILGHLPFVRMVAMTGALSVRNAGGVRDDLDYLVVARDGRVWLARLFAVMLVRLCRLWDVVICPNYVLAESALSQKRRDLFIAHEVTQMVPFVGHNLYHQMRGENEWVQAFLPNANGAFYGESDGQPRFLGKWVKRLMELMLGGFVGNWLEGWEMRRKIRKFERRGSTGGEVKLDEQQVKGHFLDYGNLTLQRFHERLEQYGLRLPPVELIYDQHSPAAD
jgi:hypothetical protein